uniref:Uncharacterized protein n=1 Tax=Glossina pallidipes TaxID=7398 RepID=A0A1A9ZNR7_GLOPL
MNTRPTALLPAITIDTNGYEPADRRSIAFSSKMMSFMSFEESAVKSYPANFNVKHTQRILSKLQLKKLPKNLSFALIGLNIKEIKELMELADVILECRNRFSPSIVEISEQQKNRPTLS